MEAEDGEGWGDGAAALGLIPSAPPARGRHVKKRALKNKGLAVGFDEKNLRDFVTGFHKRKKKRRKIAQKQLQEKERLQRIEARRKRKLEKELALYGGALPTEESPETAVGDEVEGDDVEHDCLGETQSVSGTMVYESNGMTITVTTSELSREEDLSVKHDIPTTKLSAQAVKGSDLLLNKKPFKRVANQRSRKKYKKPSSKGKGLKKGKRR